MQRRNIEAKRRRVQVGIGRSIASEFTDDLPRPAWQSVDGGSVMNLDVVSPGAEALRVGLRVAAWPDGVELRVAGSKFGAEIYAVNAVAARAQAGADGIFWTAVTDGDKQHLELFVPAAVDTATVALGVDAVSHLVVSQQSNGDMRKALGDSGFCNVDAICRVSQYGSTYAAVKDAVARMIFQSGGSSYTCTGTLLNDTDGNTQIPYFFTAHHCMTNQSEASSLTTFWRYETPSCGVDQSGPNTQLTGGGQLLYSQSNTDGALLRLNGTPPSGAVMAGWNAAPMSPSTTVYAIHHPSGDIKKVSLGNHSGTSSNVTIGGQRVDSANRASWSEGTTEGGSSGSGLFTSSSFQLRGGLFGGEASCESEGLSEAAGNVDFYSRLDQIFPSIQQYLSGAPTPGPTRDYTGQWDLASEPGRGLNMVSYNQILFALYFLYDNQGRATWYQLDPQWTGVDVASGRVVVWTGPAWGPTYNPNLLAYTQVGTFTLTFTSATTVTFAYNIAGVNRTVTFTKI
jgi:hypothetical protein